MLLAWYLNQGGRLSIMDCMGFTEPHSLRLCAGIPSTQNCRTMRSRFIVGRPAISCHLGESYISLMTVGFRFLRDSCINRSRYFGDFNNARSWSRMGKYQHDSFGWPRWLKRGPWHLGHTINSDVGRYTCVWQWTHPLSLRIFAPPFLNINSSAWWTRTCSLVFKCGCKCCNIKFSVVVAQPVIRCTRLIAIHISSCAERFFLHQNKYFRGV